MDISRFDAFAQHVSARLTRRTGLGLLAGASLPLLGLAGDADAKKKKITLCVNGKTIKKPKKQAKKLLKKGAAKGACIPPGCGNGGACTVFVTASATIRGGAIGGLAGGDAKCQAAADAANLDGTFKAWLSIDPNTPDTRFTNLDKAGPYLLVAIDSDGGNPPKVADTFEDLFTCGGGACLDNAISRDENGVTQDASQLVWTGTEANGAAADDTCEGWTSTFVTGLGGLNSATTEQWTDAGATTACVTEGRLYCFQQAV